MKKNYNILSGYSWYVPDVRGLVILVLWFLLGALLGNVVTGVIAIVAGSEFAMSYGMIIGYPLMFIPAMIYASLKSKSASFYKDGVALDSRHFGKMGGALCALLAALATVAAGYVTDGISSVLPQMPEYLKKLLQGMVSGNFWVNFLLVSIFADSPLDSSHSSWMRVMYTASADFTASRRLSVTSKSMPRRARIITTSAGTCSSCGATNTWRTLRKSVSR